MRLVRTTSFLLVFIIVFSVGCNRQIVRSSTNEDISKMIIAGYSMHDVPNDLDKPGVIFRVSPDGIRYEVTELDLTTRRAKAEITEYQGERSIDLAFILKFMGITKSKGLDVGLDAFLKDTVVVDFKLSDVELERANDLDMDKKLKEIKSDIITSIEEYGRQDHEYFIIRESLLAKSMNYSITKNKEIEEKLSAKFLKLAEGEQSFNYNRGEKFPLVFNYETPLRVFYKVEQLKLVGSANGKVGIDRSKVTEPIYYSR